MTSVSVIIGKVIYTSGVRPPSWILDTRWYTNVIVLQSIVNEATFEVLNKHWWWLERR